MNKFFASLILAGIASASLSAPSFAGYIIDDNGNVVKNEASNSAYKKCELKVGIFYDHNGNPHTGKHYYCDKPMKVDYKRDTPTHRDTPTPRDNPTPKDTPDTPDTPDVPDTSPEIR